MDRKLKLAWACHLREEGHQERGRTAGQPHIGETPRVGGTIAYEVGRLLEQNVGLNTAYTKRPKFTFLLNSVHVHKALASR